MRALEWRSFKELSSLSVLHKQLSRGRALQRLIPTSETSLQQASCCCSSRALVGKEKWERDLKYEKWVTSERFLCLAFNPGWPWHSVGGLQAGMHCLLLALLFLGLPLQSWEGTVFGEPVMLSVGYYPATCWHIPLAGMGQMKKRLATLLRVPWHSKWFNLVCISVEQSSSWWYGLAGIKHGSEYCRGVFPIFFQA